MRKFSSDQTNQLKLKLLIGLLSLLIAGCTPAGTHILSTTAYLPTLHTLPLQPPLPEITLHITPSGGLNASTFTTNAFQLTNNAANTQRITQIQLTLTTTLLPDLVFDPNGLAGDTIAKDLTIDNDPGTGFTGHTFSGPHDDGYDTLTLNFTNFDPGQTLTFSIDVDPTSIRGTAAPGPNESGSVSGLEMAGATLTATFDDTTTLTGTLTRLPNSNSGGQLILRANLPPAPTVTIIGQPNTPASVTTPNQTVRINAPAGHSLSVLVIEGGTFTAGLPGGGFDLDPYEANSAIQIRQYNGIISRTGQADIPITLSKTNPNGGLNHILVTLTNAYGMAGATSETIILELTD